MAELESCTGLARAAATQQARPTSRARHALERMSSIWKRLYDKVYPISLLRDPELSQARKAAMPADSVNLAIAERILWRCEGLLRGYDLREAEDAIPSKVRGEGSTAGERAGLPEQARALAAPRVAARPRRLLPSPFSPTPRRRPSPSDRSSESECYTTDLQNRKQM